MKRIICSMLFFLFVALAPSWALTVEEAYQLIPHKRTVFNPSSVRMAAADKEFLIKFFNLIDQATVERVQIMRALQSKSAVPADKYDQILSQIDQLNTPKHLERIRQQVRAAINEQRNFLKQWQASGITNVDIANNILVQSASHRLKQANQFLNGLYSSEGEQTKAAFFDYLCALDFI